MRRSLKLPAGWFYCQNCGKPAKPGPRRPEGSQRFCSGNCRKEFWRHGGVSVNRLKEHVRSWLREMLPGMIATELKTHFDKLEAEVGRLLTDADLDNDG